MANLPVIEDPKQEPTLKKIEGFYNHCGELERDPTTEFGAQTTSVTLHVNRDYGDSVIQDRTVAQNLNVSVLLG